MVTPVSMVACIVILWALFYERFGSVALVFARRFNPSGNLARACAVALLPLFIAQLALLVLQARIENLPPTSDWMARLPLPVYDHRYTELASVHVAFTYLAYALAVLETALVACVAFAVHRGRVAFGVRSVAVLAAAFAFVSIATPAMSTTDPYEYIAAGMLGLHSYAPGPNALAGTIYAPIDVHVPMRGVIYGPLWLAIDTAVTWFGNTIVEKVIVLRVFNALLIGVLVWLLARAGAAKAALIAIAFNPAIWYYDVVNPHSEVEGLVAVAGAFVLAIRNKGVPAMLLVAAAGLIKLPFVVAGAAAFAPLGTARRLLLWAAAAAIVFAISHFIPGPVYLGEVADHFHVYVAMAHSRGIDEYVYVIPFVCALMVAFVAFRRSFLGASWLFGQLSPLTTPWYLFWGMPYAFATRSLALFLVALPLFTVMRDYDYLNVRAALSVVAVAFGAFLIDVYLVTRRRLTNAHAPDANADVA